MSSTDFFKYIEAQYRDELPFVAYSKPNKSEVIALFQKENTLYTVDDFNERGFVFAPFDTKNDIILFPYTKCSKLSIELGSAENTVISNSLKNNELDKNGHIQLVEEGKTAIERGEFAKVVLSRVEHIEIEESNFINIFQRLLQRNNSGFVYCWYHPEVGMWLGATPEVLLTVEGNRFSTMALAGTQSYKGTDQVLWDLKEQEEQQFVTRFLEENLKPFIERMSLSDAKTIKAGNLLHLKTDISGLLKSKGNSLKKIISTLHPTPAVCGYPKKEAMRFILDHEPYNREFYTGFLGELNREAKVKPRSGARNIENRAYAYNKSITQLFVNLRCMQVKANEAKIYVGGGITKDSVSTTEWDETVNKTKTMKSVLFNLFQ